MLNSNSSSIHTADRSLLAPDREDLETAGACGVDGAVFWLEKSIGHKESVGQGNALSAFAVDAQGTGWAAGVGRLFRRETAGPAAPAVWRRVWIDEHLRAPIISIFAEQECVVAVVSDGTVVEGRAGDASRDTIVMSQRHACRTSPLPSV